MDEEKLSKFVKLLTFDGDEEKFQLWLVRFEAYATCCGFRAAVRDAPEADMPESEAFALLLDPKTDKTKVAAINPTGILGLVMLARYIGKCDR